MDLIAVLLAAALSFCAGVVGQYNCFYASGKQTNVSNMVPCGEDDHGSHFACCLLGDFCTAEGTCHNPLSGAFYIGGCTDPRFQDEICVGQYCSSCELPNCFLSVRLTGLQTLQRPRYTSSRIAPAPGSAASNHSSASAAMNSAPPWPIMPTSCPQLRCRHPPTVRSFTSRTLEVPSASWAEGWCQEQPIFIPRPAPSHPAPTR